MPVFATPSPTAAMMTTERQDSNNTEDDEEIASFTNMDYNNSVPMITNIKTKFEPKFEVGHNKISTVLRLLTFMDCS